MHLPLGMIAVGLGTVALPKASEQAANNDRAGIAATFYRSVHLCFFLVFPVAAYFIACGVDVVAILFQHGKFGPEDTLNTYYALNWYSLGLIGFAGVRVTAPVYYALKDAVRPMRYSIISVAVNLVANFLFIPFFNFAGLAAATTMGGLVNFAQLLHTLPRMVPEVSLRRVMSLFLRSVVAAVVIGLAMYLIGKHSWMTGLGDHFKGRLLRLSIQFVIGTSGYFLISYMLGNIPALRSTKKHH
jgi:putative peptidoglycan lipid II flippase